MQIHTYFYINYIIYYGLLIFCCQNVAAFIYLYNENHIEQSLSHYLLYDIFYTINNTICVINSPAPIGCQITA